MSELEPSRGPSRGIAGADSESHYLLGTHVRRHGRGPRHFVGLHGWSGSHRSFDPLLFARPENATFWAMDLPGAGASVRPSSWSAEAVTARVVSALEGLGVRKVTLVAACGGIGFGLLLAAQRPDLVARLVLIDPFAFVPWYFRLFTWPVLGRPLYLLTFANPIGRRLTDGALADRRTDETSLTEGFQEVEHTQNHRMLQAMCDAARVPLRAFGVFPGEVDIVYGARTFAAVKSSVRRLVQEPFPEARVFRAEAAGHLPMHEASAQVAEIVFGSSG